MAYRARQVGRAAAGRLFFVFVCRIFPVYIYLNASFILLFYSAYSVQFLVPTTTPLTYYLFVGAGPT